MSRERQTTDHQNDAGSPSIIVPGDLSLVISSAGDMVNSMSHASQIERGNTSAVLEIDTDELLDKLRIPSDQYSDASNHLKEIQSHITALLDMPQDQSNDAITRIDAISKYLQEMLDQRKSQQERTTIYRYYDAFLKHSSSWYGQAAVGLVIAGIKNVYPSRINNSWLWSSFASGWVGATIGNYFVRKYLFPVDVTVQAVVQELMKNGGYELEKFIRRKT